jgi:acetyl-CoA synthetase
MSSSTAAPASPSPERGARSLDARGDARKAGTCERSGWAPSPLFLLYTSGSTGKPKGVQHSTGGYLLHAALTTKWTFDLRDDDVFWCRPTSAGSPATLYLRPARARRHPGGVPGVPTYPDAGRFWKMIQQHKVTISTRRPPRSARSSRPPKATRDASENYDLTSPHPRLRRRPINPAAGVVSQAHRAAAAARSSTPSGDGPAATPVTPAGATPLGARSCVAVSGIDAAVVDEPADLPNGQGGILVVKKPWPSDPHDLGRPKLQEQLLSAGVEGYTWRATARYATRQQATSRSPVASTTS